MLQRRLDMARPVSEPERVVVSLTRLASLPGLVVRQTVLQSVSEREPSLGRFRAGGSSLATRAWPVSAMGGRREGLSE